MDKKKDEVDYAAAYRQFMNFGHGRSLKQFCEDEDYDYGKLQRYSRKAFWTKHTKLSESEVEGSGFMSLVQDDRGTDSSSPRRKYPMYAESDRVLNQSVAEVV